MELFQYLPRLGLETTKIFFRIMCLAVVFPPTHEPVVSPFVRQVHVVNNHLP
jgi:hypothetical protein